MKTVKVLVGLVQLAVAFFAMTEPVGKVSSIGLKKIAVTPYTRFFKIVAEPSGSLTGPVGV